MSVIIPAILPTSCVDLNQKLQMLQGLSSDVQIDIVDGVYANPASWPYVDGHDASFPADTLASLGALTLEIDLMVEHPEELIDEWIDRGANRLTIHTKDTSILAKLFADFKKQYGHDKGFAPGLLSLGLAITTSADVSLIEPYLGECDYVQFMGINHIGRQGELFERSVLAKISEFREKYPDMPVQVDGGVSLETAVELLALGVSRLIVGSGIWKAADPKKAYGEFLELAKQREIYG